VRAAGKGGPALRSGRLFFADQSLIKSNIFKMKIANYRILALFRKFPISFESFEEVAAVEAFVGHHHSPPDHLFSLMTKGVISCGIATWPRE
jgi:hypothetical protein